MSACRSILLSIGNALPHGNAAESASILTLWQEVQTHFRKRAFTARPSSDGHSNWLVTLDAGFMLALMEQALRGAGSFDAWRQLHVHTANNSISASMLLEIASEDAAPDEREAYEAATFFVQQLVIALNLVQPGALRLLQTSFEGDGGHRYEAQAFDAKLYYGAFRNLRNLGWWQRHNPGLDKVWQWLERTEGSHDCTAIKSLDKVLFTMLKVAEQRNEQSSRTALLVAYQLETLLDCRHPMDARHLRNRIRLILGDLPEAADCISELYAVRDGLLLGSRPVQRPQLISYESVDGFTELVDEQSSAVELGLALVIVLLRELISHDSHSYVFTERVEFSPSQQG